MLEAPSSMLKIFHSEFIHRTFPWSIKRDTCLSRSCLPIGAESQRKNDAGKKRRYKPVQNDISNQMGLYVTEISINPVVNSIGRNAMGKSGKELT